MNPRNRRIRFFYEGSFSDPAFCIGAVEMVGDKPISYYNNWRMKLVRWLVDRLIPDPNV